MARAIWGPVSISTCHSRVVAEPKAYYSVWLTMKDSDTVDEFYKYRGEELPGGRRGHRVVRFLRDRPTRRRRDPRR